MRSTLRSLWVEPAVDDPPVRVWRDWVLWGAVAAGVLAEGIFRDDVIWRPISIPIVLLLTTALLFRRTKPLAAVAVVFGVVIGLDVAAIATGREQLELYSSIFVLIPIYALFRWGSGKHAILGLGVCLLALTHSLVTNYTGIGEAIGGTIVLLFPAQLGAAIRYQGAAHSQQIEQVRSQEREQLARELHDTVAHHVSAIAVQAQAGRFLANSDSLEGAADALEVIEEAASRTLAEMRTMVEVLRDTKSPAELAPQRGVRNIADLANGGSQRGPLVHVQLSGDLDSLRPSIDAALYRLAQESITNALRHARQATRIDVGVHGGPDDVRLNVTDDGSASLGTPPPGYGIIGMAERTKLLGGTLQIGPRAGRGWSVEAVLPRKDFVS